MKTIKIFLWLKIKEIFNGILICLLGILFVSLAMTPCFLLSYYFIPDIKMSLRNAVFGFIFGILICYFFCILYDGIKSFKNWIKSNWQEAKRLSRDEI